MAGACRQDHHVARLELRCASLRAAKPDSGVPARNAEHFVNAIPPGIAPPQKDCI
jgi:hypothetical protein